MTIQLVAFKKGILSSSKFNEAQALINSSNSDILLFSGHTLSDIKQLKELSKKITNEHTLAILEVKQRPFCKNSLFIVRNGKVIDLMTNQKFEKSKDITGNETLCRPFLKELEERRSVKFSGKNILILQCGENNIVRNIQNEGNRPVFNLDNNAELHSQWNRILSRTSIVLNPQHTEMGNQGKLAKRREYLSSDGRTYFSVCNTDNFEHKSCHYGYVNGKPIEGEKSISETGRSCSWIYEI